MIYILQSLCLLVFMLLYVDSAPYNRDRPSTRAHPAMAQLEQDVHLVMQTAKVHGLLEESKHPREQTPRRFHVAEQDRGKYDFHREHEHRHQKAGEMADFILHERPVRQYKPEEKDKIQKQKLELHQAAQIRPLAAMGKERHGKAANALLPKQFRD